MHDELQILNLRTIFLQIQIFGLRSFLVKMFSRRAWLSEEDQLITKFVKLNYDRPVSQKVTWNEIANHLGEKCLGSKRTGKQCRQRYKFLIQCIIRWHNQLDPSIKKHQTWSQDQINKLFSLQSEYGNRWSKIANEFLGRTDNNLKNYFYSSLRRSFRKINEYISLSKIQLKKIEMNVLNKVIAMSDQKNRQKINIKKDEAIILALEIKDLLIDIANELQQFEELNTEKKNRREQIIKKIKEFSRTCKKKKAKKGKKEEYLQEYLDFAKIYQNNNVQIFPNEKIRFSQRRRNKIKEKNFKLQLEIFPQCSTKLISDTQKNSTFEGKKEEENTQSGAKGDKPSTFFDAFCHFQEKEENPFNLEMFESFDMNEFCHKSQKDQLDVDNFLIESHVLQKQFSEI